MLCLVSHFYPSEGLEVEWELWGGPEGSFQKAEGQRWLSSLRHHSDGSVSISGHLQPLPVTAKHHGMRYACRVHHPSLPASGRSAKVTLELAGKSQNREGGVGGAWEDTMGPTLTPSTCQVFLDPLWRMVLASSCLPFSSLGSSRCWAGSVSVSPTQTVTLHWPTFPTYSQKSDTHPSALPLLHPIPLQSLSTVAYQSTSKDSKEKVTGSIFPYLSLLILSPPRNSSLEGGCWPCGRIPAWNSYRPRLTPDALNMLLKQCLSFLGCKDKKNFLGCCHEFK